MATPSVLIAGLLSAAATIRGAAAQQFADGAVDYENLGLSADCVAALNVTVSCDSGLAILASPWVIFRLCSTAFWM